MRLGVMILLSLMTSTAVMANKSTDLKLAYVDMARVLNDVEEGKIAKGKLKADFDRKQKELDKLQAQLKIKQEEFEKRKAMMKEEIKQAKLEDLQKDFLELQQTYSRLQRELIEQESKLTQDIAVRIRQVVAKIGDRDGYTLILNIGDTVLHYKRHLDITDEVISLYNKQYGKK